jgi:hypothetical protein
MKKLFSTANVVTYGGNVKEEGFLKMLSELIGKYTYTSVSSSRQKDSGSTSRQDATDNILSVADLVALPKGRAVMLGSGARAVLVRTVPVSARPYAQAAEASEAAHNAPTVSAEPVAELPAAEPSAASGSGGRRVGTFPRRTELQAPPGHRRARAADERGAHRRASRGQPAAAAGARGHQGGQAGHGRDRRRWWRTRRTPTPQPVL